jgi:tetratricopeptide (TPR) repeat protein
VNFRELKLQIKLGDFNILDGFNDQVSELDNRILRAIIEDFKGNSHKAIVIYNDVEDQFEFNNLIDELKLYIYKTYSLVNIGDFDNVKNCLERIENIIPQIKDESKLKFDILSDYYNIKGIFYSQQGNFEESIKSYNIALKMKEKLGNAYELGKILNNLAQDYEDQGKFKIALDYYRKCINLLETKKYTSSLGSTYANLGNLYRRIKEFERSKYYLKKSLDIFEVLKNRQYQIEVLFYLIELYLELNMKQTAQDMFEKLQKLNDNPGIPINQYYENIAKVLILLKNPRIVDQAESLQLLRNSKKVIEFESRLYSIVLINIANLLLAELDLNQNPEVLKELEDTIQEINRISNNQSSILLKIQSLIIQSKIFIKINDMKKSNLLIEEAYNLAKSIDAPHLINMVKSIKDEQVTKLKMWNEIGKNYSIVTILEPDDIISDIHINFSRLADLITKQQKIQLLEDDELNKTRLLNLLSEDHNFPLVIFQVTELGIEVFLKDFDEFPEMFHENVSTEEYLMKIGIVFSVLSGQGDSYNTELLDVPAGISKKFRVIVIPFRIKDEHAKDLRLELGYSFICLFIPKIAYKYLPPMNFIENSIREQLLKYSSLHDLNSNVVKEVKSEILKSLRTWVAKM